MSNNICRYYQQGRCRNGNNCRFQHVDPSAQKPKSKVGSWEALNEENVKQDLDNFPGYGMTAYGPVFEQQNVITGNDISPNVLGASAYDELFSSGTVINFKTQYHNAFNNAFNSFNQANNLEKRFIVDKMKAEKIDHEAIGNQLNELEQNDRQKAYIETENMRKNINVNRFGQGGGDMFGQKVEQNFFGTGKIAPELEVGNKKLFGSGTQLQQNGYLQFSSFHTNSTPAYALPQQLTSQGQQQTGSNFNAFGQNQQQNQFSLNNINQTNNTSLNQQPNLSSFNQTQQPISSGFNAFGQNQNQFSLNKINQNQQPTSTGFTGFGIGQNQSMNNIVQQQTTPVIAQSAFQNTSGFGFNNQSQANMPPMSNVSLTSAPLAQNAFLPSVPNVNSLNIGDNKTMAQSQPAVPNQGNTLPTGFSFKKAFEAIKPEGDTSKQESIIKSPAAPVTNENQTTQPASINITNPFGAQASTAVNKENPLPTGFSFKKAFDAVKPEGVTPKQESIIKDSIKPVINENQIPQPSKVDTTSTIGTQTSTTANQGGILPTGFSFKKAFDAVKPKDSTINHESTNEINTDTTTTKNSESLNMTQTPTNNETEPIETKVPTEAKKENTFQLGGLGDALKGIDLKENKQDTPSSNVLKMTPSTSKVTTVNNSQVKEDNKKSIIIKKVISKKDQELIKKFESHYDYKEEFSKLTLNELVGELNELFEDISKLSLFSCETEDTIKSPVPYEPVPNKNLNRDDMPKIKNDMDYLNPNMLAPPHTYTKFEALEKWEVDAYKSEYFELGKIPVLPPSTNLINRIKK